jgi:carbonic anhydrase
MSRVIPGMTKIYEGVRLFQNEVFDSKAELFQRLGKGQSPLVLFITCSDSRVNPNLLTQTEPGELFILRNAGNIVPQYGSGGGEEATVEYAVAHLKVRHIVVCGHSNCGAMQGLLHPRAVESMPSVARWLSHSQDALAAVQRLGEGLSPQERLKRMIEQNVLAQIDHLRNHPSVSKALAKEEIKLHPWIYDFETGEVPLHDRASERFVCMSQRHLPAGKAPTEGAADSLPGNCI